MTIPATLIASLLLVTAESVADVERAKRDAERQFTQRLEQLAARCAELDLPAESEQTRKWIVAETPGRQVLYLPGRSDPTTPAANATQTAKQWHARFMTHRETHAAALFDLARRASAAGAPALAYRWLHEAVRHDPAHANARRASELEPLKSEPSKSSANRTKVARLAATSPRFEHPKMGWQRGRYWQVETPRYLISTNHSAAAAIDLAERLEDFHCAWRQLFFDYWSTGAALEARLQGGDQPLGPRRRHEVILLRNREEYVARLKPDLPQAELTLGIYLDRQQTAFFFAGDDSIRPTWHHEAAHQLFQEMVDAKPGIGERGNMWIVEGIASYFESFTRFDTYARVGGFESSRLQFARYYGLRDAFYLPLERLSAIDRDQLQKHADIRQLYTESAGLTHFLMDGQQGRHRDALVRLLAEIYRERDTPDTLARLTQVSLADLDRSYREYLNVTDADLAALPADASLKQLCLGRTAVTDEGLAVVARLPRLEWLDLSFTKATDRTVERAMVAKGLRQLFLEETRVGNESLARIAGLRELEELDLSGTQVTDDGLRHLAGLKKLRQLFLTNCRITDAGLTNLKGLKLLENVDLQGTQVSPQGLAELRKMLPAWK